MTDTDLLTPPAPAGDPAALPQASTHGLSDAQVASARADWISQGLDPQAFDAAHQVSRRAAWICVAMSASLSCTAWKRLIG